MFPKEPVSSDLSVLEQGCGTNIDYLNSLQSVKGKNLPVDGIEQLRADFMERK